MSTFEEHLAEYLNGYKIDQLEQIKEYIENILGVCENKIYSNINNRILIKCYRYILNSKSLKIMTPLFIKLFECDSREKPWIWVDNVYAMYKLLKRIDSTIDNVKEKLYFLNYEYHSIYQGKYCVTKYSFNLVKKNRSVEIDSLVTSRYVDIQLNDADILKITNKIHQELF